MRQEALCYQRLPLVSVTSRSAFRSLVQALRAQSGLLLIIPCTFRLNTHLEKFCESKPQIFVVSFLMSDGIVDEKKNKYNFSLL
jgi:hypothetical protein